MEVIDIFKDLKKLRSVKDKEALLSSNKRNKQLLELLKAGLDKERLFQFNKMPTKYNPISKYTADGSKSLSFTSCYNLFIALLDKLENREVSGNDAKQEVSDVFTAFDEDTYDLFSKILCKKALGCTAKTVNKVWPGAISAFERMKGPNELADVTQLDFPMFAQIKRDGYYCQFKEGQLLGSSGKPFKNKNLLSYFKCLNKASNYVIEAEMYMHGKPLNEHTKVFNSLDAPIPSNLKLYIFDVVPLADWNKKVYNRPYKARIKDIRVVSNSLIAEPRKVIDVHTEEVQSAAEAVRFYKKCLTNEYEGAILRATDSTYKWKRTTVRSGEIIKLKPKETVDAKIVDIFEGKDDFEGMAGGVNILSDSGVTVSVGSGFTVDQRKDMAKQPSRYVGKTIEITIMGKTSKGSYRDPRFKRFRPDKDK